MAEILVISGKGGTGKTSLTAAFAHLAQNSLICDLDVDAPDLHLLLKPQHRKRVDFFSGHEAVINAEQCTGCGDCIERCRFNAVSAVDGELPRVNGLKCEGCKTCVTFCPAEAIDFVEKQCGQWYLSDTRFGTMVHAQLFPGEENSGRLVNLLRKEAKDLARDQGQALILSDGPPGIGCPVISSLAGVDQAVVVTEPTPSGQHDLERILGLCDHFKVPAAVVINKFDLSTAQTSRITTLCASQRTPVLGHVPYADEFTHAMVAGKVITDYQDGSLAQTVADIWQAILALNVESVPASAAKAAIE